MTLSASIRRVAVQLTPIAIPDGELLSRFLTQHDEAAFAVLVRRHGPMVLGVCRRVLGNAPDADDAFQAAFVVLVRKASTLTNRPCLGTFLYTAALHASLKVRTMASRRKAKEAQASRPEPTMEPAIGDEWSQVLDEELAKLPEKYRDPVVLCELEGVSRREAAARLGIPEGTISSRLATAHRMLEKRLKMRGFSTVTGAALFSSQTFAHMGQVPDLLLTSVVRAATSGAPAQISQLATEVTKMFLLSKLKLGTIVLANISMLLGVGVWVAQHSTAAEEQAKTASIPKKANADVEEAKRIRENVQKERDQELIQGLWQAESLEASGQKAPRDAIDQFQVRFEKNRITFVHEKRTHTFELDSAAKPKTMNLTPGDGEAKGKKLECAIYELDGDTLKICMDKEGEAGKRPSEFKTTPKDGMALIVLKRVKEQVDAKRLLGKWALRKMRFDPGASEQAESLECEWTFESNRLISRSKTAKGIETTINNYTLDSTKKVKELTFIDKENSSRIEWIYELDGDTLRVAMHYASAPRPISFNGNDSPPKLKGALLIFEFTRVKEGEAKK
jgi:RNA polymerase sigma factor (sigma-70 family)